MEEKIIAVSAEAAKQFGLTDAQAQFLKGINIVDEMVGGTLGPFGRNRIIQRKYASPLVTNDGVTVARNLIIKNEIADLAAQVLVEIAMKTNETAGDGTTGAVVIGSELIRSCLKKASEASNLAGFGGRNVNPMQMAKEIWAALPRALELLAGQKQDIDDAKLRDIIATSLENLEYGQQLGELMVAVGPDGYVSTEDNWKTKYGIETELVKGMHFLGAYASPYLAGGRNEKEAIWEDTLVLVSNEKIETPTILTELIKEMQATGRRRLVIIGGHSENTSPYSKAFIAGCARVMQAVAAEKQGYANLIQILAVKAPTLTSTELEDIAVFCNAKFFDTKLNMSLADARMVHLGSAKKIVATEDDVNIVEGGGSTDNRIEVLKEQVAIEKDQMFKEKLLRRIASLSASVGIIRVGAATEQERTYLKYKIEDAVNAAKAAREEGIVKGGGLALALVAETLGPDNILYSALMAPYNRIQANAGEAFDIADNIIDAHKVVRLQLANAASAAAALISADAGIADRKLTLVDYFEKRLGKLKGDTDDFRDDENQDLGAGRNLL